MKLFILALFSVILAVHSKDQKVEDSAFLQKFLRPLNHDINQRYGIHGQEYRNPALLRNEDITRYGNSGYYDYFDDSREDALKNDGRLINSGLPLYNVPNIWGYSRNGGSLGHLVSHAYNGEPTVWGYLGNNEARLRNKLRGISRNERGPMISELGRLNNLNLLLEPEHIGYVGNVERRGHRERYNFKLIGRKGLGFDRRTATSYGMTAPLTPSLLSLVGLDRHHNDYYNTPQHPLMSV